MVVIRTNPLISLLFFVLPASSVFGQQVKYSDRCAVGLVEVTRLKSADLEDDSSRKLKTKELGTFDTVIYEEELTTKSFRLLNTKLYVVASVWYTDESMAGDDSQNSVSLQLMISRTPKREVLSGLQFAEAEVLSKNFEVARVSTLYKSSGRRFLIIMECRKYTRP